MRLTLEVISANGDALGSNRTKTIGAEGAQIGRSKESDWVINDPYISRVHARIRFVGGTYYVEGTGRNPLALNDPSNVVPNNQPQLLRSGDRFYLDQYEIRVVMEGAGERKPLPIDPFGPESDSPTVRTPVVQHSWQDVNVHGVNVPNANEGNAAGLDPLAILDGGGARGAAPPPRPVDLEQGPVIENHFTPPQPVTRPLSANEPTPLPVNAPTQKIPLEYRPGMTHLGPAISPPQEPTTRKLPPPPPPSLGQNGGQNGGQSGSTGRGGGAAGRSIPDRWNNATAFPPNEQASQQSVSPPTTPLNAPPPLERADPRVNPFERPDPRSNSPERPDPRGTPANPFERAEPRINPVSKTINRAFVGTAAPPPEPPPVAQPRDARSLSLEQLLSSAGVPAAQMSPELAQELGEVFRIVVQGVMDVLQSRAEIKSQLRMNMTLMKPAENNPLKFSPNVEAALHTLLVERNRGYLPTVRAFHEALTDIRHHQIAVLQGIRSAFHAMIEQFNPTRLEQEFERHQKRSLLNVGSKGRFRDAYVEEYERMTRDPDESFKRLFGEYFAQAYEDQMDQLKAAARNEVR